MFKRVLQAIIGPPSPSRKSFSDPILGELKPAETGWTATVSRGDESFTFGIGGESMPDASLLAHAHEICNSYESFKREVWDCVETESKDYPDDVKAEIAGLKIDFISLFWPKRPNDGMIFF